MLLWPWLIQSLASQVGHATPLAPDKMVTKLDPTPFLSWGGKEKSSSDEEEELSTMRLWLTNMILIIREGNSIDSDISIGGV